MDKKAKNLQEQTLSGERLLGIFCDPEDPNEKIEIVYRKKKKKKKKAKLCEVCITEILDDDNTVVKTCKHVSCKKAKKILNLAIK